MHILILGSRGTLGQALVEQFSKKHEVTALDKAELDITDEKAVTEKFVSIKPDVIINAVAVNAVDDIETNDELFELAQKVNGYAVGSLARIAQKNNATLIHISTDYVFDGENPNGYAENSKPNPISRYAQTKLLGEEELQKNTDTYYLVRISRLFGKKGESEASKKSFVDSMLELSKTKTHLDIVSDQFSSPSFAHDVAQYIQKLLEEKKPYGIYHATNSGSCSWHEWAQEIFRLAQISIDISPVSAAHFPRPAKAPMNSVLLNTKMPAQSTWQDALARYLLSL